MDQKINYYTRSFTEIDVVAPITGAEFPDGVTLLAIDGGPTYYADHGFTYAVGMGWDDPSYFPVGTWGDGIDSDADRDVMLDLNMTVMYLLGPSFIDATRVARLAASGLSFVASQDEQAEALFPNNAPYWVGNITEDEATTFTAGASDFIGTLSNARQDGRYWWYNGNWFFFNSLSHPEAPGGLTPQEPEDCFTTTVATPNATLRHLDIGSTDVYWFAGAKTPGGEGFVLGAGQDWYGLSADMTTAQAGRACRYGDAIDKMRTLMAVNGTPSPGGNFIENGACYLNHTNNSTFIAPAEMNAAVWSTIIHGARWVAYFNHTFSGDPAGGLSTDNWQTAYYQTIQSGETISIYNQGKATNALIASLATVINSPFAIGYATVSPPAVVITSSAADSGFDMMVKYHNVTGGDNHFYIFAMPRYLPSTTNQVATFTIANTGASQVTVINESRTISVTGGGTTFQDTFATGNTVHIYRVDD